METRRIAAAMIEMPVAEPASMLPGAAEPYSWEVCYLHWKTDEETQEHNPALLTVVLLELELVRDAVAVVVEPAAIPASVQPS
jgi:hypothetical protein